MPRRKRGVRLLGLAERDLTDIYDYVAAENPTVADQLLIRIEKDLNALSTQPLLGRIPRDHDIAMLGFRYLIIGDYLAFYRLETSVVLVYRILHGGRDYSDIH
ncbi:MAG: type II toxin-antitoxin system RelE/ParE family toxin [Ignavibacteriae bacterium]|nr:type II toxin-antitoxin system RelE/ParE family toxin [Ignavibacteriota bacterium]